eukprot:scaffold57273_cov62-Attheya_sp.AAC.4
MTWARIFLEQHAPLQGALTVWGKDNAAKQRRCKKCSVLVTWGSGIFSANIGWIRGRFSDCQGVWCAECYGPHPLGYFEVTEPQDFDGTTLAGPEDWGHFVEVRAGDHIICPFQCDICHIRNIKGRDPCGLADKANVALVRQANLDVAFWRSRAKGMVAKHCTEVRYELKYNKELDYNSFPALGPYALGDDWGM